MLTPSCQLCFSKVELEDMEKHLIWHKAAFNVADALFVSGASTKEGMLDNRDRLDVIDEEKAANEGEANGNL